jgi:hypothetical protein
MILDFGLKIADFLRIAKSILPLLPPSAEHLSLRLKK